MCTFYGLYMLIVGGAHNGKQCSYIARFPLVSSQTRDDPFPSPAHARHL